MNNTVTESKMKWTGFRIVVSFVTFAAGVLTSLAWVALHHQPTQPRADISSPIYTTRQEGRTNEDETSSVNDFTSCLDSQELAPPVVCVHYHNSRAISIPQPVYPTEAKAHRVSGEVVVSIVVNQTGRVIWAHINNGHPLLQPAVREVVCQARFTPTTLSGHPVKVRGLLTYRFVLD